MVCCKRKWEWEWEVDVVLVVERLRYEVGTTGGVLGGGKVW